MSKIKLRFASLVLALTLVMTGLSAYFGQLSAQEKNFLWKAPGSANTVYILGSIHLLKRESATLKPIVHEVFDKSKHLVLEIDLLKEGPDKFPQLLMQKGVNLNGKMLPQQLSPETYELAAKKAGELGIDIKLLAPLKPWVVALTMVVMQLQKLGYDPSLGIDHQLAQRAKQENKSMSGLETADFQMDLFNDLTAPQQEMFLRQSLLEMDQLENAVDAMVGAWNSGDVARGERLFLASLRAYPELKDKVLDARNRRWIPQIEQLLKQNHDVLVVVGTAHLVGKSGVIELLKDRGYKLEQM
ncbi:MAG: TraB/GumN family protein [Candidatus Binatia bacterium]